VETRRVTHVVFYNWNEYTNWKVNLKSGKLKSGEELFKITDDKVAYIERERKQIYTHKNDLATKISNNYFLVNKKNL